MDGEWQQQICNVHDELDLSIPSDDKDWNNLAIAHDESDDDVEDPTDEDYNGALSSRNKRRRESKNPQRHSREQIQQLEALFLECSHPGENLRLDIAEKLGLGVQQVKFWFQNRRTANKNQLEKEETKVLRHKNEVLKAEHQALNAELVKKTCPTCGGPMVPREETLKKQHLLIENAKLKDELFHATQVLNEASGKVPIPMPGSYGQLADDLDINVSTSGPSMMSPAVPPPPHHARTHTMAQGCVRGSFTRALLERVDHARAEFMMMVKKDNTMWLPTLDGEVLDYQRYHHITFPGILGQCPKGFGANGTRDVGVVMGTAAELVNILTDTTRLCEAFPGLVASVTSNNIAPASADHGQVQLMNVGLMVLSPRIPICNALFARQCHLIETNTWAVVDVAVNDICMPGGTSGAWTWINGGVLMACRMLPSGCLIEDMNNGYCKVTWIVNIELDRTQVTDLHLPLLRSAHALGARRWLTSLQRRCQYLAILRSDPARYVGKSPWAIPPEGRNGVLELAQQMTTNFCASMSGAGPRGQAWISAEEWRGSSGVDESFEVDVRVATLRIPGNEQGVQAGLVVSAATMVWLPGIPAKHVFDYICDGNHRAEWDTFSNGAPMQQEDYVVAIQSPRHYAVSVLHPKVAYGTIHKKLILQQTCADASCKLLAYAPADEQALKEVMRGGNHAAVSLLPSGFIVLPDGHGDKHIPPVDAKRPSGSGTGHRNNDGCFLSVLLQRFLSEPPPPEKLTKQIINNVGTLVAGSIVKIKEAVHASIVVTATT